MGILFKIGVKLLETSCKREKKWTKLRVKRIVNRFYCRAKNRELEKQSNEPQSFWGKSII